MYVGHQASGLLVRAGRNAIPTTSKTGQTQGVEKRIVRPNPDYSFFLFQPRKNPRKFHIMPCIITNPCNGVDAAETKKNKTKEQGVVI